MENETEVIEQPVEQKAQPDYSARLAQSLFGELPTPTPQSQPEVKQETITTSAQTTQPESTPQDEEEIVDVNEWLKREFETEDVNILKQEREELKKLRETPKTFEFKNDDSRKIAEYINDGKIDDLYSFLDTQKKIDKLSKADVSDKNIAAELVKFGIQKDNPTLDANDVDFLFNQTYSVPDKPVQHDTETDEDYQHRVNMWQQHISNIERKLIIEAKMQQPKLAQLKTELVLPNIEKESQPQQRQPTPEELAAFNREKDNFLQSAQKSINDFNGFSTQVKDKDVDFTVNYSPSQEEKVFIDNKIKRFAESGFDANALFAEDWVEADGKSINVKKMTEDLSRIYFGKNADTKLAVDAANKRLEAYLKEKKQINVTPPATGTFNPPNPNGQTESDRLREKIFG